MFLGEYNELKLDRFTTVGAYLVDPEGNDVLLPSKYLVQGNKVGDILTVFLYKDSEDRLIATTYTPDIYLNEFAWLQCTDVNFYGAFVAWGIEKDLMVPFKEQLMKMEAGKRYLVYLYLDEATQRLVATMKYKKRFALSTEGLEIGQEVDLLIGEAAEIGRDVIVNHAYKGMIYKNDIVKELRTGKVTKGYIYNIREDLKLDIRLTKDGYTKVSNEVDQLLEIIMKNGGYLGLNDASDPDEVRERVGMSKKTFKKAVGALLKERKIILSDDGIELIKNGESEITPTLLD
jgi:predicted RNA-binding protein (virulence factor B family)